MLHAVTFDLHNSSVSRCSTQTLLSGGKRLQVVTKALSLDIKLVQWVCADFCEVIWRSEMQLGSIPQWTSVLVSLLVSWLFSSICPCPAGPQSDGHGSLLSLPLFFSSPSLHNVLSSLSVPSLSPSVFVSASDVPFGSRGHGEGHRELHCYIFVPLFLFIASTSRARSRGCMYNPASFARAPQFLSPEH